VRLRTILPFFLALHADSKYSCDDQTPRRSRQGGLDAGTNASWELPLQVGTLRGEYAIYEIRPLLLFTLPQSDRRRALNQYRRAHRAVSLDAGGKPDQTLRLAGGKKFCPASLRQLQLPDPACFARRHARHRAGGHARRCAAGKAVCTWSLEQSGELG